MPPRRTVNGAQRSYGPTSEGLRRRALPVSTGDHGADPIATPAEHGWLATPPTVQLVAVFALPMSGEPAAGVKSAVAGLEPGFTNTEVSGRGGLVFPMRFVP